MRRDTQTVAAEYAEALTERGLTLKAVGWPNRADHVARYQVLLEPVDFVAYDRTNRVRILDLGCGPGFLLDYIQANGLLDRIDYTGVDITEPAVRAARSRWPCHRFELRDIRDRP